MTSSDDESSDDVNTLCSKGHVSHVLVMVSQAVLEKGITPGSVLQGETALTATLITRFLDALSWAGKAK